MSIVKDEYLDLLPHGERLSDVVVLAQAWKKSHGFIRRHNWYADVLELDVSTIDLETKLAQWGAAVAKRDFRPKNLLLVPAPKNARWEFPPIPEITSPEQLLTMDVESLSKEPVFGDWRPKAPAGTDAATKTAAHIPEQKLRPLAHLSIRDQTLTTAVMMCLAESVETIQGDTSGTDIMAMRQRGVVSYGNRLHCTWSTTASATPKARFSWGNGRSYRQYFQDYRTFLARPRKICAELTPQLATRRELYIVSLDLKSFFDQIDTEALIAELRRIEAEHHSAHGLAQQAKSDKKFWRRVRRIFGWRWRNRDHEQAELIFGGGSTELKLGLPQGLVASGFLANAYLVRFDATLSSSALSGTEIAPGMRLMDYCRYVDDMRIVVEAKATSGGLGQGTVLESVKKFVSVKLDEHCAQIGAKKPLGLSLEKCEATSYRAVSAQSHMSALMEMLNAELSGTFDLDSLVQAAGGLDGLLGLSDQVDDTAKPKPSRLALATIAVQNTDVRDDTVKRFVATRLSQLLRQRLAMTNGEAKVPSSDPLREQLTEGMLLAHEFESTARKLIKGWAENPALVLLLRCGLDLFPHPRLLTPVAQALGVKLFASLQALDLTMKKEVRAAEYVLADLLRAGAVETGFRDIEEYPQGVDIQGYRTGLGALARRVLTELPGSPWYLRQQARLYLAAIGDYSLARLPESDARLRSYEGLHRVATYEIFTTETLTGAAPYALIAQQLNPNADRFGAWLTESLINSSRSIQSSVVRTVALNRPELLLATLRGRKSLPWREFVPRALLEASRRSNYRPRPTGGAPESRSLLQVMSEPDNIFGQENALLMLAAALLRHEGIEQNLAAGLSASDIVLKCCDWSDIQALPSSDEALSVESLSMADSEPSETANPLYSTPPWVDEERAWLYGLGRILRAALTGEFDFTGRRFLVTEEIGRYTGMRSTWFMRRFGLLNSGRGLLDEPAPVSPWLSSLLSTLLQWPGVDFPTNQVAAAGSARTASELLVLIETRIASQRTLYGVRSKTPMYVVPVNEDAPLQDRPLRIAIVQPMRPRRDEFDAKDPTHWTPGVVAEHLHHLAAVCKLTHQKLKTWETAKQGTTDVVDQVPVVDVVLFPELAVHPEHVFLLRRLSDKLRANVFAGLTFLHSAKAGGIVNQGLWLIRSESPTHGRSLQYVWQGKLHPMKLEQKLGIKSHRPHLTLVELPVGSKTRTRIAAAICYDATDLDLVADLRDRSDIFLVAALNQDVQTFDNMVAALHFHMYQPVVLANSGEFGGSTAQVPLPKHERLLAHVHGNNQVAVSVFEVDPSMFKSTISPKPVTETKAPPAGYRGRPI